jgi:gliding motility-associated-like protein
MHKLNMTRITLWLALLLITTRLSAQLQATGANTPPFTPQNLISNIFLGNGVEVSNIQYNGDPIAVGYFTGGNNVIGIERGIILTSGRAAGTSVGAFGCNATGSDFASNDNNGGSNDPNLGPLSTEALRDVAAYTITFTPTSDTLRFRYCFASEEYPEYACSDYNDIFGFFISGPGFPSPTNIAYIPNSNFLPVAINNIHPNNPAATGPCPPLNVQYYNNNNGSGNQPTYDGFTDVFTAQAIVQPCAQYTIRLVIADVFDGIYDSGVFLEAKSFGTGSLRADLATPTTDGTVTEGCLTGTLKFSIPSIEQTVTQLDYNIFGSATNGVDIQAIPNNLTIPAGQTEIIVPIIGIEDNQSEGSEFIGIDYQKNPCERDTVYIFIRDNSLLPPQLPVDTFLCSGTPLTLDATAPVPTPIAPSFTNTNDINIAPHNTPFFSNINVAGVQPPVLGPGVIRSVCVNLTHPFVDDIDMFLISPSGQFIELTTDNGADGNDYTNTCFTPTATTEINYGFIGAPAQYAPFTGNFLPEGIWDDLWGGPTNGQWRLQVIDDSQGISGTLLDWSITFEPLYKIDYQWSPGSGVSCATCPITDITGGLDANYSVVATDSYGCTASDSIEVRALPQLIAPTVVCGNGTETSVIFEWDTIANAESYEININGAGWIPAPNDTFHLISNLQPSTPVSIEVRAVNSTYSCPSLIGTEQCINCAPPSVTVQKDSVSCFGLSDGRIVLTPDGANPPYTFRLGALSNSTGVFDNLNAGQYNFSVVDGLGCDTLISVNLMGPAQLQSTVTMQQAVRCFGQSQGILTTLPTGGNGGYTYNWSTPVSQTTNTASGLAAGTYSVTISDTNGCSSVFTGTVTQPTDLLASATKTDVTCFGTSTGTATASPSGGTGTYTYQWTNGQTTLVINNLVVGAYTVTVTDSNNCTETASIAVAQPTALTAATNATNATCFNTTDGTATALPAGGVGPYTYTWSTTPVQAGATASNLLPQTYTVTITDARLCTVTASATVNAPQAIALTMSADSVSCRNGNDGQATVVATGGVGTYTYTWSSNSTNAATISGLIANTYTVTVRDSNGCTNTASVAVRQPDFLLTFTSSNPVSCFGRLDGRAKVDVSGGVKPYSYQWSGGGSFADIINRPAGLYTVTITDFYGCTATRTVTIETPDEIKANIATTPVLCYDGSTGVINAQVQGGVGGFFITWIGPNNFVSNDENLTGLYAGTYTISMTDSDGCSAVQTVEVTQPTGPLQVFPPLVSDTICFNATNGIARIDPIGGTAPYSFAWNDSLAQTVQYPGNLDVGNYTVTVTDANGCYVIDSTFILSLSPLFAFIEPALPSCTGGTDAYAEVTFISYGSTEVPDRTIFDYRWSTNPAQTNAQAVNLSANATYFVTVTDKLGCTATQTITIGDPPQLTGNLTVNNVKCFGDSTGQIIANGGGGTPPYSYLWSPNTGVSQTDQTAINLAIGNYKVTITDAEGCTTIETTVVNQPPQFDFGYDINGVKCFGDATGTITAKHTGGTPPYSIAWDNNNTGTTATGLPAGFVYTTITDANNCIFTDSIDMPGPASPIGGVVTTKDVNCFGAFDGSVFISGSGGTPPYQYTLDNRPWNGSMLQIGLGAGKYGPQVRDNNGCVLAFPQVEIKSRPAVVLDLGSDITIELGQNTQIFADVSNAADPYSVIWEPLDSIWLSCLDCEDPQVNRLFETHEFEAIVIDSLGCRASDDIIINVEKPRKVFVPTGFTPDNNSTNDKLLVHGQSSAKVLVFRIFDRWGELLYEATDFQINDTNTGWDGTFRGQPMIAGVYVWTLEIEFLDGARESYYGQTTLIR